MRDPTLNGALTRRFLREVAGGCLLWPVQPGQPPTLNTFGRGMGGVADGGMALAAECIHQKRPPALSCNGEAGGSVGSGGVGVSTGFQTW
ncbi:hypothetical protein THTE_0072 [Thermogutta terrifontis]|uniref:Uncharacterized protein n=1 Tax=Thermogutta terrifontis TaxID=1331910 RepID=A0A286R9N3_9BACT|nr:hypothetical protein THTE_0072 [Thermogutta terrifontis]